MKIEGFMTLFNGLGYTLKATILTNFFRFMIYENIKKTLSKYSSSPTLASLGSSFIANTVTTTLTFPFEFWKTK